MVVRPELGLGVQPAWLWGRYLYDHTVRPGADGSLSDSVPDAPFQNPAGIGTLPQVHPAHSHRLSAAGRPSGRPVPPSQKESA
ncbi:hypothetical protein GCM10018780_51930 [Streptomyces lanatus]|nr:hypothetical protein GCM10018780_51930 [Streptomyces lanatus]